MEANLYSGPNASPSLKYLNPLFLHTFLVDEPPKNDENNGLLAGMLWLHRGRLTLHGQLLLDDFDLLAESGEPPSLALTGTLHARLAPAVDAGARLSVLSARVYNTHQPEGRYLYLLRGLGTTSGGGGLGDIGVPVAIMLGFVVVMLVVSRLVPDRGVLS